MSVCTNRNHARYPYPSFVVCIRDSVGSHTRTCLCQCMDMLSVLSKCVNVECVVILSWTVAVNAFTAQCVSCAVPFEIGRFFSLCISIWKSAVTECERLKTNENTHIKLEERIGCWLLLISLTLVMIFSVSLFSLELATWLASKSKWRLRFFSWFSFQLAFVCVFALNWLGPHIMMRLHL